jgi:hypothetical protein
VLRGVLKGKLWWANPAVMVRDSSQLIVFLAGRYTHTLFIQASYGKG